MKNKKLTQFMALAMKQANKRVKEENHIKKIQRQSKLAKRNYGCNSKLSVETDWDAVLFERHTNRFYRDKLCKGHNTALANCMCEC